MKKIIEDSINSLEKINENSKIEEKLDLLLNEIINYIHNKTNIQPSSQFRKFSIKTLNERQSVSFGIERDDNVIKIADWLVNAKSSRSLNYLKCFVIAKESIIHFIKGDFAEIEEAIINILTILWLKEIFSIRFKDSELFKTINSKIYLESIDGVEYDNFLHFNEHLFLKEKKFIDCLNIYKELTEERSLQGKGLLEELQKWLYSFFSEMDMIAPLFLNKQLFAIVKLLVELGCEKANVQTIAERLRVHPNTIRNNYKTLANNYCIFWNADINLDKLKLHKYFLKIIVSNERSFEKVTKIVWDRLHYNDRMFIGEMNKANEIIYCPTVLCPHLVVEKLNGLLTRLLKKGEIVDYTLREIRERFHYGALTTNLENPSIEYFERILKEEEQSENIHSFTFSHTKDNLTEEIEEKSNYLDYNLLYFLSKIRGKSLLKSGRLLQEQELEKLYKMNDIALTDIIAQTELINQIEIRAKRRGLITYDLLLISKFLRSSGSTIFEVPTIDTKEEEKLAVLMKKLQKFSFLGNIVLSDRVIGLVTGISHHNKISKMIEDVLIKNDFNPIFYTVKLSKSRGYQFYDLYNYKEKKWKMNLSE